MRANKLKSVLCLGNGPSLEPHALAYAGFKVVALDISPLATEIASAWTPSPKMLARAVGGRSKGRGGSVTLVTGDLRDPGVCPGPFDVIIERRTLQLFHEEELPGAMKAVADRLASPGIFLSHSHRNRGAEGMSQAGWFRAQGWPFWSSTTPLTSKTAWLVSTSG